MMRAILLAVGLTCLTSQSLAKTRIKDITTVRGVRANQLLGYGLVVGLKGTGDSLRSAPFTKQSIRSMLDRLGVSVNEANLNTKNVAAVIVTAELPPFVGRGSRIDVSVSSLGDASSLEGGTLILTPLSGANKKIYAVAQGPLAVTGFSSKGQAETLRQGVPTVARIPNGALVERDAVGKFAHRHIIVLELRNPDFNTAIRVTDAINAYARRRFGKKIAQEDDLRTIRLLRPRKISAARFIAELGNLTVRPDANARVVIDERTGTIVIGSDVQISPVAVTHGNLTVRITETPRVSQPGPFSNGETTVAPETLVAANQTGGNFAIVKGATLQNLVRGLNRVGLKPTGIIAILQAIKSSGALQADLVVQ